MILLEKPKLIDEHRKKQQQQMLLRKINPMKKSFSTQSIVSSKSGESNFSPLQSPNIIQTKNRSISTSKLAKDEKKIDERKNPFFKVGNFFKELLKSEEEEDLSRTFTAYCGTQQIRQTYNIQLKVLDRASLFKKLENSEQAKAIKQITLQTLYSNNLSAAVLFIRKGDLKNYGSSKINQGLAN